MGAAKDKAMVRGAERESGPPSSRSRPVLKLENQTDPSLPPPDPNRTIPLRQNDTNPLMPPPDANRRRQARRPPEAGPDSLDTPEYVAPLPPPAETEHKTFEVQTVKIMEEDRRRQHSDPGLRQADIPTAPSTRIQRRRSWTMAVVLIALGVTAGLGLYALAHLTRVEPMEPGTPSAVEPAAPPPVATADKAGAAPEATAPAATPSASAATPQNAEPTATAKVEPTSKPPRKHHDAEATTTSTATATVKGTSTVPLGPPEF